MQELYDYLGFPKDAFLGHLIDKNTIIKRGRLSENNIQILNALFVSAKVLYTLTQANSGKKSFTNEVIEYSEIQVVEVEINRQLLAWKNLADFARIFFKAIPYPLLLIIMCNKKCYKFFAADFHTGKSDSAKNVIERLFWSSWIDFDDIQEIDGKYFEIIKKSIEMSEDLKELYETFKDANLFHTNGENRALMSNDIDKEMDVFLSYYKDCDYIEKYAEELTTVPIDNTYWFGNDEDEDEDEDN